MRENTMSESKTMTQVSPRSMVKSTLQNNNNGKQKQHNSVRKTSNTKSTASNAAGHKSGKENQDAQESAHSQASDSNEGSTSRRTSAESPADDRLTELDTIRPVNGLDSVTDPSKDDQKSKFTKQQSEASSSGATAENNAMNESTMTTESSLANKSMVTSISVVTDRSGGAQSGQSSGSNVSSAMIKADGVENICKFYAKRPEDKKKCLLRDVAVTDDGEIFITDSKNRNIKVFTIKGEFVRSISHPELKDPYGIAILEKSKFVVSDCKGKDLKIFTLEGELLEKIGRSLEDYPMKSPTGLAINSKGEIVVSDSTRKCVYIYPIEGVFCEIIWGEAGLKPLQFKNPRYVGVTRDDDIIVSDYFSKKIAVFDAQTHDLKFTYGNKSADKKLSYPRGVASDMEGNILIADNYNGKIHHVNANEGNFIQFVYGDKHSIHRIRSVACDNVGHMVLLENGGRVKVFDISQMHAKAPSDKTHDETLLHALFTQEHEQPESQPAQSDHEAPQ